MEYKEAREYCVMLLACRKAIDKAVEKFREAQTKKEVKMLKKLYTDFDPEGDKLTKISRQEIPFVEVRWGKANDKFTLERPEAWLRTFREALAIYKSSNGDIKYSWIAAHFSRSVTARTLATKHKVTRSTIYDEFKEFKNVLLCVAVQNGLLTIEKNQEQEDKQDV